MGLEFGRSLKAGDIVCLYGELGAGKTTFAKGLVAGAAGCDPDEVASPTFVYVNVYDGVNHFDLYRLAGSDAFVALGLDEMLGEGICCIEWAERISDLLPDDVIRITLSHVDETTRRMDGL